MSARAYTEGITI